MRRLVNILLLVSLLAAPLAAKAQPTKVHRIGYLSSGPGPDEWSRAFLQGMRELVVNLKTAKALGLTIPQSMLLRADEVIQ